jgi:hypothetical protein
MLCKRIFVVMAQKQLTPARRQPRLRLDQVLMMCKRSVSLLLCLSGLLGVGCMNISDQDSKITNAVKGTNLRPALHA